MEKAEAQQRTGGSFRDPCGFIFTDGGSIYRQINLIYKEHYEHLIHSGLYQKLIDAGLLISHIETRLSNPESDLCYKIIQPETLPFVSFPYEWCFSQLKQAALATLKIQKTALDSGMSLKDASAYNIQFRSGKPILIDTLSFEMYKDGSPWIAYKQFCQHFLAPLALMSRTDIRLNQLARIYIDGIPLDLASKLLGFRTYFNFSLFAHIHLHAKSQKHFADKPGNTGNHKIRRMSLLGLIDNLESAIKKLKWKPENTEWANYYEISNYTKEALEHKQQIVDEFLDRVNPKNVWDFGANTGIFSRLSSRKGIPTVSFDADPAAVEKNFLECLHNNETDILPLLIDLTNPSPDIGWDNRERASLYKRGPSDLLIALALLHHLAISNNVPFSNIAEFFGRYCNWLIIEFVPKSDDKVKLLLSSKGDIFPDYTEMNFKKEFNRVFDIIEAVKIKNSERTVYLMKNKAIN
jgi:ribosomal protein L11 methylase PrmA